MNKPLHLNNVESAIKAAFLATPVRAKISKTREEELVDLLMQIAKTKLASELEAEAGDDSSEQLDAIIKRARICVGYKPNPRYGYYINLNERGYFEADVRDTEGKSVYEIKSGLSLPRGESDIFDDGFMTHAHDTNGLCKHLQDMKVVEGNAVILKASDFEKATA